MKQINGISQCWIQPRYAILCIYVWGEFRKKRFHISPHHNIQNILCTCTWILNSFPSIFFLRLIVMPCIFFFSQSIAVALHFSSYIAMNNFLNNPFVRDYVFLFLRTVVLYFIDAFKFVSFFLFANRILYLKRKWCEQKKQPFQ